MAGGSVWREAVGKRVSFLGGIGVEAAGPLWRKVPALGGRGTLVCGDGVGVGRVGG